MSVTRPDYYNHLEYQTADGRTINLADALYDTEFDVANIFKYVIRHNAKEGQEDLTKALEYLHINEIVTRNAEPFSPAEVAVALYHFVLDSLSSEEKANLDNKGIDLALALLLVREQNLKTVSYYRFIVCAQILKMTYPEVYPEDHENLDNFTRLINACNADNELDLLMVEEIHQMCELLGINFEIFKKEDTSRFDPDFGKVLEILLSELMTPEKKSSDLEQLLNIFKKFMSK